MFTVVYAAVVNASLIVIVRGLVLVIVQPVRVEVTEFLTILQLVNPVEAKEISVGN